MRKLALVAVTASLFLLGLTSAASATSVNLVWTGTAVAGGSISGTGTSDVTLTPSATATLTLDIQLDVDSRGTPAVGLSLRFDTDLGNELNILSFQELSWTKVNKKGDTTRALSPLSPGISSTQESFTGVQEGQLFSFDGTTGGTGPSNSTLTFARVVFAVNHSPVTDGNDVFSGAFNPGVDAIGDNPGGDITSSVVFGNASVNLVPEPSTISLLGLGLGTLILAGRRRSKE